MFRNTSIPARIATLAAALAFATGAHAGLLGGGSGALGAGLGGGSGALQGGFGGTLSGQMQRPMVIDHAKQSAANVQQRADSAATAARDKAQSTHVSGQGAAAADGSAQASPHGASAQANGGAQADASVSH